MKVTIKDIAIAADVSVGTVDRALHNRGRIRPEVAQRILSIAKEMDYSVPASNQPAIQSKKKYTIAVILHIYHNDFYTDVFAGIRKAKHELRNQNINIEIYHCKDFDAQDQLNLINTAIEDGASAIAIVAIDDESIRRKLTELHQQNFPILFLSSVLDQVPHLTAIHCDHFLSGCMAAGLLRLLCHGEGSVLFYIPSLSMSSNQLRLEGFRSAIAKNSPGISITDIVELPNDSLDSYQIISSSLAAHSDTDYVVYTGNARSGLKAIQECGRKIHSIFYDMNPSVEAALRDDLIDAAIIQSPQTQGYRAIMILYQYLVLKKIPESVSLVDYEIVLKETLDT